MLLTVELGVPAQQSGEKTFIVNHGADVYREN